MRPDRIGFHVSAFGSENLLAALSACSRNGFSALEIFGDTTLIFADRPDEFRVLLDIAGVNLAGVHSGGMLTAPEFHDAEAAEWERMFGWVRDVGGEFAVYCGGESCGSADADVEFAARLLNRLGAAATSRGVALCYETDRAGPFQDERSIDDLLARTDPTAVRFSVDTALFDRLEIDHEAFLKRHRDRIGVVHVRDLRRPSTLDLSDDGFVDPGEGMVDLVGVKETLRGIGYDGWLVGVVARPHVRARRSLENTARFFRETLGLRLVGA